MVDSFCRARQPASADRTMKDDSQQDVGDADRQSIASRGRLIGVVSAHIDRAQLSPRAHG